MQNRHNRSLTLHGIKHKYGNIQFTVLRFNGVVYVIDSSDKEAKNVALKWYNEANRAVGYRFNFLKAIHNGIERPMVINFICKENNIKELMESFKQQCGENSEWTIINT